MAQACNPSALGGQGKWITRSRDRDHPGQHGETPSLLKIQKISWAQWRVPVIPATQEAEAGEMPEPRRQRLQWAEIAPLHSSLGNKSETLSQKKEESILPSVICWNYIVPYSDILKCHNVYLWENSVIFVIHVHFQSEVLHFIFNSETNILLTFH